MKRSMTFLLAALFLWGTGEGMFLIFQPLYMQELGANPITIGAVLGAFGLVMTIVHIPAGLLSDRIGRLPLLRAAWISGTLATIIMASANNLTVFVAGLLLYAFTIFVASPLSSFATAARGTLSVGRALTLVSVGFNSGMIFGPLIGGWLGESFGFRSIYLVAAGLFIISTMLVFFLRPQPVEAENPQDPPPGLLHNRQYISFLVLSFFVVFAMYLPQPLTPNFLQNERGLSLASIGMIASAGGLGNTLLNLVLGGLRLPFVGFLLAQLCVFLFTLLVWRGLGVPIIAFAYFLLGGYRVARTLAAAQAREFIHDAQMGLAYGIMETVNSIPVILAPPLAGFLYAREPASIYPLSLALIGLALVFSLAFVPRKKALAGETHA